MISRGERRDDATQKPREFTYTLINTLDWREFDLAIRRPGKSPAICFLWKMMEAHMTRYFLPPLQSGPQYPGPAHRCIILIIIIKHTIGMTQLIFASLFFLMNERIMSSRCCNDSSAESKERFRRRRRRRYRQPLVIILEESSTS